MNPLFLFYLVLLPWTLHSPFPHLPVKIIWADLFFLPMICKDGFDYWRARKLIPVFSFDKAAFLFLGILLFNVLWMDPSLRSVLKYLGIMYTVAILIGLRMIIRKQEGLTAAFWIWFGLALLLSLTGIVAYCIAQKQQLPNFFVVKDHAYLGGGRFLWRLWSIGYTPSMLTAYLHIGLLSALWLKAGTVQKSHALLWRVSIVIILSAILLTKSRLVLGALVSLVVWELFHFKEFRTPRKIFIAALSLFTLLFSIVVMGSLWYKITPVSVLFQQSQMNIQWNQEPSHYQFRNRLALALLIEHPLMGIGLGKYQTYSQTCQELLARRFPDFFNSMPKEWLQSPHDPHSTYQGWVAETGLVGGIGMLIFLAVFLRFLLQKIKERNSLAVRERYVIFLAGLAGFLVHGLSIDILTLRYFWFFLGCLGRYAEE